MADVQLSTRSASVKTAYEANFNTNAYTDAEQTKLAGIEAGATADQTASEIVTAYDSQVAVMTQAEAEAGTSATVRRVTAQRIGQAIAALGGGGPGSFLQAGTGAVTRSFNDKMREVFTPQDFGALPNLSLTSEGPDCSAAINLAIDAAAELFPGANEFTPGGSNRVYLPAGVYWISNSILVKPNVHLCGSGWSNTIIKLKSSATCHGIKNGPSNAQYGIMITDLTVDGNQFTTGNRTTFYDGVNLVSDVDTTMILKNLRIRWCSRDGLVSRGGRGLIYGTNIIVRNVSRFGMAIFTTDDFFVGCEVSATGADGVRTSGGPISFSGGKSYFCGNDAWMYDRFGSITAGQFTNAFNEAITTAEPDADGVVRYPAQNDWLRGSGIYNTGFLNQFVGWEIQDTFGPGIVCENQSGRFRFSGHINNVGDLSPGGNRYGSSGNDISWSNTVVADAAWGTPSGNNVTITSAGGGLPLFVAEATINVTNHSNAANNGVYLVSGSPTVSTVVTTKLTGTLPPVAAAAEDVTMGRRVSDRYWDNRAAVQVYNSHANDIDFVYGQQEATFFATAGKQCEYPVRWVDPNARDNLIQCTVHRLTNSGGTPVASVHLNNEMPLGSMHPSNKYVCKNPRILSSVADGTPSVAGAKEITVSTAGSLTITALDDGVPDQVVLVKIGSITTLLTIDFTGTTLKGNGGVDWTPATGDAMLCRFDGTNWYCSIIDAGGPPPAPGFIFDNSEAQTLVNAMAVAPDDTRKGLIDDLVGTLKTDGDWVKLDGLWILMAHDAQAARLNWKNPAAFTATLHGTTAPVFSTDIGFETDGIDNHIDLNFDPAVGGPHQYVRDSACFGSWTINTDVPVTWQGGHLNATEGTILRTHNSSNIGIYRVNCLSNRNLTSNAAYVGGLWTINRSASNAHQAYQNTTSRDTFTTASVALASGTTFKLGHGTDTTWGAYRYVLAFVGSSLDSAAVTRVYNALNTYVQAIHGQLAITTTGATAPNYSVSVYPPSFYDAVSNTTWLTWEAKKAGVLVRQHQCRTYNHTTGAFSAIGICGDTSLVDDDHGVPAAVMDHQGYVHVIGGSHNSAFSYFVTSSPNDPSAWTARTAPAGSYAYPKPVALGDVLLVFARSSALRHLSYQRTTALSGGVPTWGGNVNLVDFGDGVDDGRFYGGNFIVEGDDVLFVATRANITDTTRDDVYFFRIVTNPTTHAVTAITNLAGTTTVTSGSFPVTLAQATASYKVVAAVQNETAAVPVMVKDSAGAVHFFYQQFSSPNWQIMHAFWNGTVLSTPTAIATEAEASAGLTAHPSGTAVNFYYRRSVGGVAKEIRRRVYSGGTWGASVLITSSFQRSVSGLVPIYNGHANASVQFSESASPTLLTTTANNVWVYGDNGYVSP